jgi:hypothetical protein
MTYHLGFRQGPISSCVRIKDKDFAILFDPDANVDICITFTTVLIGFLEEIFFPSALSLSFGFLAV